MIKILVTTTAEAIDIAGKLVKVCNDIRYSNIDDVLQISHENFLCFLRDSIEVSSSPERTDG